MKLNVLKKLLFQWKKEEKFDFHFIEIYTAYFLEDIFLTLP